MVSYECSCPFRFRSLGRYAVPNVKLQEIGKCLVKLGRKNLGVDKNCGFKTPHVFGEMDSFPTSSKQSPDWGFEEVSMWRRAVLCVSMLFALVLSKLLFPSSPGAQDEKRTEALVHAFNMSRSDAERVRSAAAIVRHDIESGNDSLLEYDDDSIALLVFWHRRCRKWVSEPGSNGTLRKNDMKEFAAFIKSRLDVSAPPEWLDAIAAGKLLKSDLLFDAEAYFDKCSVFQTESLPHIASLEKSLNGRLTLSVVGTSANCGESRQFVFPDTLSDQALEYVGELYGTRTITAICSGKSNIVSFSKHDPTDWRFEVHSFTNEGGESGDFAWNTSSITPWKLYPGQIGMGTFPGACQLRVNEKSIFIFSLFRFSFCIEELDLKSGELRSCFSHLLSEYWLQ